jgi:two-component system OmpR family sensor kinase
MVESGLSLFLPLAALVPISVVVIWFTVGRALAPIDDLSREIGKRDRGNLDPLPTAALPTELAAIASSVDRLLDRLRHAIDAERAFAANSAHELRTPVAGALTQIQRLIAEVPEEQARNFTV